MPSSKADHPEMHLAASAIAAIINFPLWKASAMGQSGFDRGMKGGILKRYIEAMKPPYKGMTATIVGMTWARAFIFYGSDRGKRFLEDRGNKDMVSVLLPPLVCSTAVQLINMPIIRASITIQDPATKYISTADALRGIYQSKGLQGLWHGTSAGVMKTVPKYCVAVAVKNYMERTLRPANPDDRMDSLIRSAKKSVMAGVAGAALTNPVDVVRNEMFKTDLGVHKAFLKLWREEGTSFALRGINKNLVAVAIPIAVTIFCTDFLVQLKE
ncbi:unnamed protein product, partial [Discosporangium mesarthrocarpum]